MSGKGPFGGGFFLSKPAVAAGLQFHNAHSELLLPRRRALCNVLLGVAYSKGRGRAVDASQNCRKPSRGLILLAEANPYPRRNSVATRSASGRLDVGCPRWPHKVCRRLCDEHPCGTSQVFWALLSPTNQWISIFQSIWGIKLPCSSPLTSNYRKFEKGTYCLWPIRGRI